MRRFITEKEVESALDFLRDNANVAAEARANRIYLDEFRKSLKAQIMSRKIDLPVNAQERDAYSDPQYLEHLEALRTAIFEDERHRFLREAADAKIRAWQTQEATERSMAL